MNVLGRGLLAVTNRGAVRKLITGTRPGRALSTRFVAGETLEQAVAVATEMNGKGASVSLDHLGEHVTDRAQAEGERGHPEQHRPSKCTRPRASVHDPLLATP